MFGGVGRGDTANSVSGRTGVKTLCAAGATTGPDDGVIGGSSTGESSRTMSGTDASVLIPSFGAGGGGGAGATLASTGTAPAGVTGAAGAAGEGGVSTTNRVGATDEGADGVASTAPTGGTSTGSST